MSSAKNLPRKKKDSPHVRDDDWNAHEVGLNRKIIENLLRSARLNLEGGEKTEALSNLREILDYERNHGEIQALFNEAKRLHNSILQQSRNSKIQLLLVVLFCTTALAIAVLGSMKLNTTEIDLRLEANQISFRTKEALEIYSLEIESISIVNPEEFIIDALMVEEPTQFTLDTNLPNKWNESEMFGRLKVARRGSILNAFMSSNYIVLTSLFVDSGAVVTMAKKPNLNKIVFEISGGRVSCAIEFDERGNKISKSLSSCGLHRQSVYF